MSNKKTEGALTPKLRFPEFQDDWEQYFGNRLFNLINNKDHDSSLPVLAITQEHGAIPRDLIDYQVSVTDKSIESYKVVEVGDFIISLRSFQGGIEYSRYRGICSPAYIILRKNTDVSEAYFKYFFKTERFIQQLQKNLEGLRDGKMVSYQQFSELLLPMPSKAEQQKIADCLTSIDELIAAERAQLDALKAYKKGLLQNLFPAEGESLPRLRFPEFQDAGAWEILPIGVKVDLLTGYPFDGLDISENPTGIRLLRGINVTEGLIRHSKEIDRYYPESPDKLEKYRIQKNDLVIGMDGSKVGRNAAIISESDGGSLLVQRVARLRSNSVSTIRFIFQQVNSSKFHTYVDRINTSSGIPHISSKQINDFQICFPSLDEQQKIAEFLTSIDEQIAAQSQRLAALHVHKKGLLQGLFPSAGEVK
ncbi:MAG: restriction endonuclease subunit S [Chloroflexi bacterium HGW-Chloroflexi-6]|nr:MAG: restriction endonuclease subunit S [Chloroflexi bacterium HGW-Chloroflexi-6]